MQTTIGGDRLGSGSKETVSFRNYERSTHDLSYIWRSSMASGTLVPFMSKVALPGDKWEINLGCEVLTLPTLGPLFGSYKVQLDVFEIPIRLYNAKLHMNRLGIGMDMKSIFLPQIEVLTPNRITNGAGRTLDDNEQINASSLLKYLGISGLGSYHEDLIVNPLKRKFNAIPLLAYWSIYKNYYSNKQEEIGFHAHTTSALYQQAQTPIDAILTTNNGIEKGHCLGSTNGKQVSTGDNCIIYYPHNAIQPDPFQLGVYIGGTNSYLGLQFTDFIWDNTNKILTAYIAVEAADASTMYVKDQYSPAKDNNNSFFGLESFPLENIDKMRDKILQYTGSSALTITKDDLKPYSSPMESIESGLAYATQFSQESLGIKTYQSDLFNNWINTEWIDGTGGISELTAVDTTTGEFTIDALNIATKVYEMLNRIAVSGGSYDDWLEAVYTHERVKGIEEPVYCGSLIKELAFEEVISLAETTNKDGQKAPLGTLAGRGRLTGKHKGGKITISVNEPSYIMALVSLTPRVDYSQGNDWSTNLKTLDDLHKPALDGIGFQDLITEQMLWSDTVLSEAEGQTDLYPITNSLGKQPAWINYMTDVNKTYGAFAEQNNSMFMTLNRRYSKIDTPAQYGEIKDGTTYIDPSKFNGIFAETALSAQNFWVQIACNITARRKMSAKIIPNL
ncbi:MAG: major capsid protein [Microviridae sp.]|nr:MAG: major capsid protein [Microviridae sp.]